MGEDNATEAVGIAETSARGSSTSRGSHFTAPGNGPGDGASATPAPAPAAANANANANANGLLVPLPGRVAFSVAQGVRASAKGVRTSPAGGPSTARRPFASDQSNIDNNAVDVEAEGGEEERLPGETKGLRHSNDARGAVLGKRERHISLSRDEGRSSGRGRVTIPINDPRVPAVPEGKRRLMFWICDKCHLVGSYDYGKACQHEMSCQVVAEGYSLFVVVDGVTRECLMVDGVPVGGPSVEEKAPDGFAWACDVCRDFRARNRKERLEHEAQCQRVNAHISPANSTLAGNASNADDTLDEASDATVDNEDRKLAPYRGDATTANDMPVEATGGTVDSEDRKLAPYHGDAANTNDVPVVADGEDRKLDSPREQREGDGDAPEEAIVEYHFACSKMKKDSSHTKTTSGYDASSDTAHGTTLKCSHPHCTDYPSKLPKFCWLCKDAFRKDEFNKFHEHAEMMKLLKELKHLKTKGADSFGWAAKNIVSLQQKLESLEQEGSGATPVQKYELVWTLLELRIDVVRQLGGGHALCDGLKFLAQLEVACIRMNPADWKCGKDELERLKIETKETFQQRKKAVEAASNSSRETLHRERTCYRASLKCDSLGPAIEKMLDSQSDTVRSTAKGAFAPFLAKEGLSDVKDKVRQKWKDQGKGNYGEKVKKRKAELRKAAQEAGEIASMLKRITIVGKYKKTANNVSA